MRQSAIFAAQFCGLRIVVFMVPCVHSIPAMTTIEKLTRLARYWSIRMTAEAGSGHFTSSLSATDLMTVLMFGGSFHFDVKRPQYGGNDRLIFSKGHASPLFFSLWHMAGVVSERQLLHFRKFTSEGELIQGHPTVEFPYAEATTGSLGQGLSVGLGMALNTKYIEKSAARVYVLLGDSEMMEGSVWEAMAIAAHYKLDNLVAIVDVNRLGQRGETIHGHATTVFEKKAKAFGWEAIVVDGHNIAAIKKAYSKAARTKSKPVMIIARTLKGKGVSFAENKDGWHGKAPSKAEEEQALKEFGTVDLKVTGKIAAARKVRASSRSVWHEMGFTSYDSAKPVATRRAYGNALVHLGVANPHVVVLDAETSNSTYAEFFKQKFPDRFFEMFIAEQNMVGAAQGFSRRGSVPFVSTFAAFLTRAYDQIRMGGYSQSNVKFCGSHAGVSIGEDGASQMGLEDIAMFRSILGSTVVYPSDALSTERLVQEIAAHTGACYIRTTRKETPILYGPGEKFPIGGSKVLHESTDDVATIVAAGITLHEALKAHDTLKEMDIMTRVIDLYSIKPLDIETLKKAAKETNVIVTVEDHYPEGGIGEAVCSALASASAAPRAFASLAVRKLPRSGKPDELLDFEDINARAIVEAVSKILSQ